MKLQDFGVSQRAMVAAMGGQLGAISYRHPLSVFVPVFVLISFDCALVP